MTSERLTLKIADRFEEPGNILRLRLARADGAPLKPFDAGAHLDLRLKDGSLDLWRQYSLCSDPAETGFYEIGVLLDPKTRGGSAAVHRLARPDVAFEVEGPRNHFPLAEEAEQTVLFGGGIGITPMLAMARRLHALGRDFVLHYCTRSEGVTAFRAMIAAAPWADRVVFHFDDQPAEQRLDLARDLPKPGPGTHLYVCGPQGFHGLGDLGRGSGRPCLGPCAPRIFLRRCRHLGCRLRGGSPPLRHHRHRRAAGYDRQGAGPGRRQGGGQM